MEQAIISNRQTKTIQVSSNSNILPDLAKEVMVEINKARTSPKDYVATITKYQSNLKNKILNLPTLPQIITSEGSRAFEDAIKSLSELQQLNPLVQDDSLCLLAQKTTDKIIDIDDVDDIADIQIQELDPEITKNFNYKDDFSFICHIGSSTAEILVMHLLVDDGDRARENRNNLLRASYTRIGVSSITHPIFDFSTVIVLASLKTEEKK